MKRTTASIRMFLDDASPSATVVSALLLVALSGCRDSTPPPPPPATLTFADIQQHTVGITSTYLLWSKVTNDRPERKTWNGSGVIVKGGFVLTNRHVVDRTPVSSGGIDNSLVAQSVKIFRNTPKDDVVEELDADIVAISKTHDLALLRPRRPLTSPITIAEGSLDIPKGTALTICASAGAIPGDEKAGGVLKRKTDQGGIQISNVQILETWSGSPIFLTADLNQGLVGLVNKKLKAKLGRTGGMAVSSVVIRKFLDAHRTRFDKPFETDFKAMSIGEVVLSPRALKEGKDIPLLDEIEVSVVIVIGKGRSAFYGQKVKLTGKPVKDTITFPSKISSLPWKTYGHPVRIELWELDDPIPLVIVLGGTPISIPGSRMPGTGNDDLIDYYDYDREYPQDATFPLTGRTIHMKRGSTISFRSTR